MLNKKRKIAIIIGLCIFIILAIFCTIFALLNIENNNIISGIKINGIDVSNLSISDAKEKLSSELLLNSSLHLTYEDYETTLSPSDINFVFDIDSAIQDAYSIGRSSNIFINNFQIFFSLINTKNITAKYDYDQTKLDHIISDISVELPGVVVEPSYYIENSSLIICTGSDGITLNSDELQKLILSILSKCNSSSAEVLDITIPTSPCMAKQIDIENIYEKIHTEPKNAYIEKEPFALHLDVDGVDFAITMDEAKALIQDNLSQNNSNPDGSNSDNFKQSKSKEIIIPLNITKADITVNDLGDDIFVQTFSTYTSRYDVSNTNRSTNVEIATSKLNDVIVLPGETFSYNRTVGERTISAGYKEASIYTSNGVEYGLGGGVCQVSSTLYNAILEANLEIVERKNHRYSVSYVPLGRDATVSYGSIDFKFKNNRTYPIKLKAYAQNGVVSISVVGLSEDKEYNVSIITEQLSTIPFETQYINDYSLPVGSQVVKQKGSYGYKVEAYKVVSLNGSIVSKTLISTDTYIPLPKIVLINN